MKHTYVSTACQHDKHQECRLKCKFCVARCLCECHREDEAMAHAKPRPVIRGSRRAKAPTRKK